MGIQRWAAEICRCEFGPHIEHESTEDGSYILYSDHIEREKVLREALELIISMLECTEACLKTWNKTGSPVNVEYGIEQARAALHTVEEDSNGD